MKVGWSRVPFYGQGERLKLGGLPDPPTPEHGGDEKLICVPVDTTFPYYSDIGERQDLPSIVLQQIEHFFTHYKDLESEKWVRIGNWGDADDARRIVLEAIERARESATA